MSEEIEAYMVLHKQGGRSLYHDPSIAEEHVQRHGGTVVKLTGEMPRELRKVSTEVWIEPIRPTEFHSCVLQLRLGIKDWGTTKTEKNTVRAKITMEELGDE